MDVTAVSVRAAEPAEAPILTALALRSKAHHGYDEAFIESCRDELTVSRELIADHPVFVVDDRGSIAGFYALRSAPPVADLAFLFIDPPFIGKGYGRLLFDHAVAEARRLGCAEIRIEADPYAERFYIALGAESAGEVLSGSIPGRTLPLLRYRL